jgi:hypothetical protein
MHGSGKDKEHAVAEDHDFQQQLGCFEATEQADQVDQWRRQDQKEQGGQRAQ